MRNNHISAFSLTELLVALAILGIVAAAILPRFLNVQKQANDVVAAHIANQLNHTLGEWTAAGGTVGPNAMASDILRVLTDSGGQLVSLPTSGQGAADPSQVVADNTLAAAAIRLGNIDSSALPAVGSAPKPTVALGDTVVWYDNASQSFKAYSQSGLEAMQWSDASQPTQLVYPPLRRDDGTGVSFIGGGIVESELAGVVPPVPNGSVQTQTVYGVMNGVLQKVTITYPANPTYDPLGNIWSWNGFGSTGQGTTVYWGTTYTISSAGSAGDVSNYSSLTNGINMNWE